MKHPYILLLFILLGSQFTIAQNDSIPKRKEYITSRAIKSPKIDGLLDDETWQNVPIISDFKQNFPNWGAAPSQKTEVRIVYDNTAIYIAAFLDDSCSDSICKQLGNRDDHLNADNFRVVFDTYNTEQDAFDLTVTASGVQSDSRFSDYLYNAVWESSVKLYENGWSVEMKIPYSALRFPNTSTQLWGMQITRNITRNGEFDQWGLLPRGVSNPFKYWGYLKGMESIKQPIRLSLTPYITAYTSHYPANIEGESNYSSNITGGLDLKYGINESFTVDATLLPDFSQVQSDNLVKNLGAFEQLYDEQRPFFQESTDLFQKGELFYSRRIGRRPGGYYSVYSQLNDKEVIVKNPDQSKLLNATKVSGRTPDGLGVGLLNAIMDNTYATVKDSLGNERKILTEPFSNYNIVVFDQQMKNSSSVYLINTNVKRNNNGNNSNVTGGGFNLNNKKNTYFLEGRSAVSNIFSKPDTVTNQYTDLFGYQYSLVAGKSSGWLQFSLYQLSINPTFNINDMGITRETNFINRGANVNLFQFKPYRSILNSHLGFDVNHNSNFTTHQTNSLSMSVNSDLTFKSFHNIYLGGSYEPIEAIDNYEARVPGRIFKRPTNQTAWTGINSDTRKKISFNFNVYGGITGLVSPTIGYNPYFGMNLNPTIRVNDRLTFALALNYSQDDGDRGFVNFDENNNIIFGLRFIKTVENVLAVKYLFRNNLSITLRGRHYWTGGHYKSFYNLTEEGYLIDNISYNQNHDFNFNAFNSDVVFQWQFAPGSSLNLVWKNIIYDEGTIVVKSYSNNFTNTMQANQLNTVSLKVLYYFDYLYLRKKRA
ncbi:hypothetical protein BH10BAC1_BH10BAC1_07070 [soil metagenome]